MRILLVATRPEDATAVESTLLGEGHTVTTCFDSNGGPCRGTEHAELCPLESSVDLAVIARGQGVEPGLLEMGATCAVQHRVGVVAIDPAGSHRRGSDETGIVVSGVFEGVCV